MSWSNSASLDLEKTMTWMDGTGSCETGFSPKELLLGIVINTPQTEPKVVMAEPLAVLAMIYITYVAQQCLDRYKAIVKHMITWKHTFDK
jgi:hypothetical protein